MDQEPYSVAFRFIFIPFSRLPLVLPGTVYVMSKLQRMTEDEKKKKKTIHEHPIHHSIRKQQTSGPIKCLSKHQGHLHMALQTATCFVNKA